MRGESTVPTNAEGSQGDRDNGQSPIVATLVMSKAPEGQLFGVSYFLGFLGRAASAALRKPQGNLKREAFHAAGINIAGLVLLLLFFFSRPSSFPGFSPLLSHIFETAFDCAAFFFVALKPPYLNKLCRCTHLITMCLPL